MKLNAGQVAVVTGGASGIGFAMADAFAQRGLDIVLADVESSALERASGELARHDVGVFALATDVRFPEQLDALASATLERFGRVDIICNNAGVVSPMLPIWEVDERDWEWVLSVNLRGVISGMRAFVPHLIAQGTGHVVNTASMAGLSIIPTLGPYTAAKHAVVALSETLSIELADIAPGVGVTVVCPGMVESNISAAERNRPADLVTGVPMTPPDESPAGASPTTIAAAEVGEAVVAAIEANRLHIAPNGSVPLIEMRVNRLLTDLQS